MEEFKLMVQYERFIKERIDQCQKRSHGLRKTYNDILNHCNKLDQEIFDLECKLAEIQTEMVDRGYKDVS